MVKGDIFDYFGLAGYTNEQLKQMGYIVWMPVQEPGSWLGEGDTGTFMNLPDNGLRAEEAGDYGGWGGRNTNALVSFQLGDSTAADTTLKGMLSSISTLGIPNEHPDENTFPDFFPAAQRDFASRLKWSVTSRYADANHAPEVSLKGPPDIKAFPGEQVQLVGNVSDPDGDAVSVKWWQFRVGSYPHEVAIANPASARTKVVVPADALAGQTIHLVLEATDNGSPALTRYQRVVIHVRQR